MISISYDEKFFSEYNSPEDVLRSVEIQLKDLFARNIEATTIYLSYDVFAMLRKNGVQDLEFIASMQWQYRGLLVMLVTCPPGDLANYVEVV